MLEELFYTHRLVTQDVPLSFKRYLYNEVDWQSPCVCISGARGTGKTTLLLQHYHEQYGNVDRCLYLSADMIDVTALGLLNVAKTYFKYGGEALIIDEIHKYPSWQLELKNILDLFKKKRVIFSGSSSVSLQRGKVDLSRRAAYYPLKGLSFREYLQLRLGKTLPVFSLEEVVSNHVKLAQQVSKDIPVLKYFSEYLEKGYYPFFLEGEKSYLSKVLNVIEKVLYEDVVVTSGVRVSYVPVLKRLLWMIATSVPFTINIEKLSRELGVAKAVVYAYLEYLSDAGLICLLREDAVGLKMGRKPEKVLLENVNLLAAINRDLRAVQNRGTVRETFLANQCMGRFKIHLAEKGDFVIDQKYTIEVGGKGKDLSQLGDNQHGYVAADEIEIGFGRKIPLYLFGFMY